MGEPIRWRWGVLAALALTLPALVPQLHLWYVRGHAWQGAFASCYTDEAAYAAYVNALIEGRPRKNDPYSGRADAPDHTQPESFFSIQFVPAYLLALPARALGLSAATVFIVLLPVATCATALALFWLLRLFVPDGRVAAVGVLIVLCLGPPLLMQGTALGLFGVRTTNVYLLFLRRYVPAVPFPFFYLFCGAVWLSLTSTDRRAALVAALAAGALFALLVFSYFFLWTAAAAWLCGLMLLWLAMKPEGRQRALLTFGVTGTCAVAALAPYAVLLARRAATTDAMQALEQTRAPDLFHLSEALGAIILLRLAVSLRRGRFARHEAAALCAAAFALTPFIIYNQQVVTGRSLQPAHYDLFVLNYCLPLALCLTLWLLWQTRRAQAGPTTAQTQTLGGRALLLVAVAAYGWGTLETATATRRLAQQNQQTDALWAVGLRLAQLAAADKPAHAAAPPVVFTPDTLLADHLPISAPQPPLWALHVTAFTELSQAEQTERLYQFLYYTGVAPDGFAAHVSARPFLQYVLFGPARAYPDLTRHYVAPTPAELQTQQQRYASYVATFERARAAHTVVSYLVTSDAVAVDLTNFDRWYERSTAERLGGFTLYRVKLRP